jgi:uncharacterized damage-inducible protein DinB
MTTAVDQITRLRQHMEWADDLVLHALNRAGDETPAEVVKEYAHLIGVEEVWLARIEGRVARSAIWPASTVAEATALAEQVREGYARMLATVDSDRLPEEVTYKSSAGADFTTSLNDILLHVMLHGQYHRGRINLLLRQSGAEPAPTDYISFVWREAAAVQNRKP